MECAEASIGTYLTPNTIIYNSPYFKALTSYIYKSYLHTNAMVNEKYSSVFFKLIYLSNVSFFYTNLLYITHCTVSNVNASVVTNLF